MSPNLGPKLEAENVLADPLSQGHHVPVLRGKFFLCSLQKEKSRSGRTTGAMRVHMYKVKHIQAEMIFTHTADMLAEIVSGNGVSLRVFVKFQSMKITNSSKLWTIIHSPMLTSLPGLYQLVRVIMT